MKKIFLLFALIFLNAKFAYSIGGPPPCMLNGSCCGGTGYSDDGGISCYCNITCTTACGGCNCTDVTPMCCPSYPYSNDGGTNCFQDSGCTQLQICSGSGSGGLPEMPTVVRVLIPLALGGGVFFLRKRRKKKTE